MLNISRILSKLSLDYHCSIQMSSAENLKAVLSVMSTLKNNTPALIRIAFVLANLTANYEEARYELSQLNTLEITIQLALYYFEKDELVGPSSIDSSDNKNKNSTISKKEEQANIIKSNNISNNVEELLTKLIRLIAN